MAGRPSKLSDPQFVEALAELYAAGKKHVDIAEELGCHKDSIGVWIKDARVTVAVNKLILERANRIARKIDSTIEARLAETEKMDTEELLKIRREMLRSLPEGKIATDTAAAASEISEAMDQSPELAEQLRQLVEGKPAEPQGT